MSSQVRAKVRVVVELDVVLLLVESDRIETLSEEALHQAMMKVRAALDVAKIEYDPRRSCCVSAELAISKVDRPIAFEASP